MPKPSLIGLILDECGKHPSDPWSFGCECAGLFAQCARMLKCVANQPLTACIASTCLPAQCGTDLVPLTTFTSTLSTSSTVASSTSVSETPPSSAPDSGANSGSTSSVSLSVSTPSSMSLSSASSSGLSSTSTTNNGLPSPTGAEELPVGLWIGLGIAAAVCLIGVVVAALVWRQRRRRARGDEPVAPPLEPVRTERAQSTVPKENSLYVPGSLTPSQVPQFTTNVSAVGTRAADSTHARSTKRHRHRRRNGSSRSGSNSNRSDVDSDVGDDDAANGISAGYEAVPSLSASGRNKNRHSDGYDAVPPTVTSKNGGTKRKPPASDAQSEGRLSSVMPPSSSGNGYDLIPSVASGNHSRNGSSGYDKLPGHGTPGHTYELVPEVHTTNSVMLKRK
jgi:hypothetical protein